LNEHPQIEGMLREVYSRDGRYYDILIMRILKSEWGKDDPTGLER